MIEFEQLQMYAIPAIKVVLILLVGHFAVRCVIRILKKCFSGGKLDASLISFIVKTVNIFLHLLVILSALNAVGISTTGFIAALSAAVVAVGLALKDSLSNIAGGVLLLVSPRFYTGDYIDAAGRSGTVVKVDLLHTTIRTVDNKIISIPNGVLINSDITNYSREADRRVDIEFGISYDADPDAAKQIILDVIHGHPLVKNEPAEPLVRVISYGDSAVNIVTRSWCDADDYWTVYFDLTEQIRHALESNDISIPYNQLDVHIRTEK